MCSTMKCGVMKLAKFILLASQTKFLGIIFCDISIHPHVCMTLPRSLLGFFVFWYLECKLYHYRHQYTQCVSDSPQLPVMLHSSCTCTSVLHSLPPHIHHRVPHKSSFKGLYFPMANSGTCLSFPIPGSEFLFLLSMTHFLPPKSSYIILVTTCHTKWYHKPYYSLKHIQGFRVTVVIIMLDTQSSAICWYITISCGKNYMKQQCGF